MYTSNSSPYPHCEFGQLKSSSMQPASETRIGNCDAIVIVICAQICLVPCYKDISILLLCTSSPPGLHTFGSWPLPAIRFNAPCLSLGKQQWRTWSCLLLVLALPMRAENKHLPLSIVPQKAPHTIALLLVQQKCMQRKIVQH
jgi:hypothetical protein